MVLRRISGDFSVWVFFFAIVLVEAAARMNVMLGDTFEQKASKLPQNLAFDFDTFFVDGRFWVSSLCCLD